MCITFKCNKSGTLKVKKLFNGNRLSLNENKAASSNISNKFNLYPPAAIIKIHEISLVDKLYFQHYSFQGQLIL